MTVKEIFEKTEFGKSIEVVGIRDYNISYLGSFEYYLEMYKKAARKNAAFKYRQIKALLDQEAVVIEDTYCDYYKKCYYIRKKGGMVYMLKGKIAVMSASLQ